MQPRTGIDISPATGLPGKKSHGWRCAGCGYNLTGLTGNRCPECGRAFDPEDPQSFAPPRTSALGLLVLSVVCQGILVLAPLLFLCTSRYSDFVGSEAVFVALGTLLAITLIAAIALWVWAVGKSFALLCQPKYLVVNRWAAWVVLAEAAGLVILVVCLLI